MIAWLNLAAVLISAAASILAFLTAGKAHAQGIENAKAIQHVHETLGLLTATEQRRKWAADHPRSGHP